MEGTSAASEASEAGEDGQLVSVAGGLSVPRRGLDDDDEDPILFHARIGVAGAGAEVGSADLEVDDVVRVINDALLVRLRVADSYERFHGGADAVLHGTRE